MYDDGDRLFCAFDKIAKEDPQVQSAIETADIANRVRTINEVRQDRGLEPYDDERANDPFYTVPTFSAGSPFGAVEEEPMPMMMGDDELLGDGKAGEKTAKKTIAKSIVTQRASALPFPGFTQRRLMAAVHQEA
jgi:hypothetical protein